jgi:putative ABC transport system permease protein
MRLADGIRIALSSLRANRLRTFLTLLGIIIGIASIISVVSIIEGMNAYWQEKVADLGANVFMVNQFGVPTSRQAFLDAVKRNKEITIEDYETIRAHVPAVRNVGLRVGTTRELRYGNQKLLEARVVGMTANMLSIQKVDVEHGRFFTSQEEERAVPVAFVGTDVRDQLFPGVDPLGKTVKVGGRDFRVIGVAEKQGSVFGASQDNFAYIPLTVFQKMYGIRSNLSIYVIAEDDRNMEEAIDQTRVALRASRHLKYGDDDNFGIVTAEGMNAVFKNLTRIIFSVAVFVVGISLVVGGIVIMNIMLVAVTERTREVGLRKAVGARSDDILKQFLIESVVLCCLGGLIGVALALLVSRLIGQSTPLPSRLPLGAPGLAVALCSVIGIFFGIYPARQAARLNPIDALRSE